MTAITIRKDNKLITFREDAKSSVNYYFVPGGLKVEHTEKKTTNYLFPIDQVDSILINERGR